MLYLFGEHYDMELQKNLNKNSNRCYMDKLKREKYFSNSKNWIFLIIIIAAPVLINMGLVITDIIYMKTGFTLTAYGLDNVEWLDFWKQYLSVVISFFGIYLVYRSSSKDRKMQWQEKNAEQYLDTVKYEESILVEVVENLDTGVVYEALLQKDRANIYEGRKILSDSKKNMIHAHIRFELLTELCDDFKKCEKCSFSPCADKLIMVELRDLFYDMEKHYFNMLDAGERFFEHLNQEQRITDSLVLENSLKINTQELINLCRQRGLIEEAINSEAKLECIKARLKGLEKSKLQSEEINKFVTMIQEEKEYIEKIERPKFIRYCKTYIDMKKAHVRDLRTIGYIKYSKVDTKNNS